MTKPSVSTLREVVKSVSWQLDILSGKETPPVQHSYHYPYSYNYHTTWYSRFTMRVRWYEMPIYIEWPTLPTIPSWAMMRWQNNHARRDFRE